MRVIIYLTIALLATQTLTQTTNISECVAGCGACIKGHTCIACQGKVTVVKVAALGTAAFALGSSALWTGTVDYNVTDCSSATDNGALPDKCLLGLYGSTTNSLNEAFAADKTAGLAKTCTQCQPGFGPNGAACAACATDGIICDATTGALKQYACAISKMPASFAHAACGGTATVIGTSNCEWSGFGAAELCVKCKQGFISSLSSATGTLFTATGAAACVDRATLTTGESCKDMNCLVCKNVAAARCELCAHGFVWSFGALACVQANIAYTRVTWPTAGTAAAGTTAAGTAAATNATAAITAACKDAKLFSVAFIGLLAAMFFN